MGPEEIGLPGSILREARCSARSFSEMRVAFDRLVLAGDVLVGSRRCTGNKIPLPRKSAAVGTVCLPGPLRSVRKDTARIPDTDGVRLLAQACCKSQY